MLSNDSSAAAESPPTAAAALSQYRRCIFATCHRLLGHAQDAEDATQETLLRAIRYWHRLDPSRPVLPWLRQIAINRCRTTRRPRSLPLVDGARPNDVADQTLRPCGQSIDQAELLGQIHSVLKELPPVQAEAFLAVQSCGESHAAVARRLGRPVGTVKTWVHRTRLHLIDRLADPTEGC